MDHGSLSVPLPLVKDGDLMATVRHMIRARGPDTVMVTKVQGLAIWVGFGLWIGSVMLRLMLLLIWAGAISLSCLWMPGVYC